VPADYGEKDRYREFGGATNYRNSGLEEMEYAPEAITLIQSASFRPANALMKDGGLDATHRLLRLTP